MKDVYEILEHIEKRPALYLGNDWGITALNNFLTGFMCAGGLFYSNKKTFPNFSHYSTWIAGRIRSKYDLSAGWHWHILNKYDKDERKSLNTFFKHLHEFKKSKVDIFEIKLTKAQIRHCNSPKTNMSLYTRGRISKAKKVLVYRLLPSKAYFSITLDNKNKPIGISDRGINQKELNSNLLQLYNCSLNDAKAIKTSPALLDIIFK